MLVQVSAPHPIGAIELTLSITAITGKGVGVNNYTGHKGKFPVLVVIEDGNDEDLTRLRAAGLTAEEYVAPPKKWWQFWR